MLDSLRKWTVSAAAVFCLISLGLAARQLRLSILHEDQGAASLIETVTQALQNPQTGLKANLAQTKKAIRAYEQLADDGRQIAISERNSIEDSGDSISRAMAHLDQQISGLNTPAISQSIVAAANSIPPMAASAQYSMTQAGNLLADPNLRMTAANIQAFTFNMAETSGTLKHSAQTWDRWFDKTLFPAPIPWYKRPIEYVWKAGQMVQAARELENKAPLPIP